MIVSAGWFLVVLGTLIFVHELGHFIVAKMTGVGVEKFSLGFGPRIFGKKVGMTDYRISAIPLGGYVKMVGESPDSPLDDADIHMSFSHKSVWKRMLIVAAGPFCNLLLPVIICTGYFIFFGLPIMQAVVGGVDEKMPAYAAGIRTGDRVVSIDGVYIKEWEQMAELITRSNGRRLEMQITRGQQSLHLSVTPKMTSSQNPFGESIGKYIVGISPSGQFVVNRIGPIEAIKEGVNYTIGVIKFTLLSVVKIFSGSLSTKSLGGPIMIAQLAGSYAKSGMTDLLFFIAVLSVNLGILNLLPIPVLDGGHLLFFLVEAVARRPINLKMRELAQQIGIVFLVLLMLYVIYNDVLRLFNHSN